MYYDTREIELQRRRAEAIVDTVAATLHAGKRAMLAIAQCVRGGIAAIDRHARHR